MLTVSTQITPEDDLGLFARMLQSVSFAGEIRIYSFGRQDREFLDLARKYRAEVIELDTPYPKIVEVIRGRQIREAQGEWVLIMDYDELITERLAEEIREVVESQSDAGAYIIGRKNFSLGFPISHGGFGDDYVHRLFRKSEFRSWPKEIHSTPAFESGSAALKGEMEHHKDASLSQMVAKTDRYSAIEAGQFLAGGLPAVTPVTLIRKPAMEFIRRYFLKKGFLDGRVGLIQSMYQGFSVFISYAKLFELQQKSHRND